MQAHYPDLAHRHILVTGGALGIGKEIATAFSEQGAQVSVIDISKKGLAALSAQFPHIETRAVDLRQIPELTQTIASLVVLRGPIYCLVNNAANDDRHEFESMTSDYWDERMAINLRHMAFATQAVVPGMRTLGSGSIVNIGSNSWMRGIPGMVAYTTAKSAGWGLTKSLARELGPSGIRVNMISPGWVMTERQIALWATPEKRIQNLEEQALKSEITPADIASAVLFLASDASRMCTGQNIVIDGGIV